MSERLKPKPWVPENEVGCGGPMSEPKQDELVAACDNFDWMQPVLNQSPPCFHFEPQRKMFCGRAERWDGHNDDPEWPNHKFISLAAFVASRIAQARLDTYTRAMKLAHSANQVTGEKSDYYVTLAQLERFSNDSDF